MDYYKLDHEMQQLTKHQKKLLGALYEADTWMTRSQVARFIGKKRLTPYDIRCLNMMAERGLLERSTQPTDAPGSDFAYIYNMPYEIAELLERWSNAQMKQEPPKRRRPLNLY